MAQQTLVLSVTKFADPQHWTWQLATPRGKLLGKHRVALDSSQPEYEAFVDLDNYLRLHTAPDQRNVYERQMLERVGAWVGREVLGGLGELIVKPHFRWLCVS